MSCVMQDAYHTILPNCQTIALYGTRITSSHLRKGKCTNCQISEQCIEFASNSTPCGRGQLPLVEFPLIYLISSNRRYNCCKDHEPLRWCTQAHRRNMDGCAFRVGLTPLNSIGWFDSCGFTPPSVKLQFNIATVRSLIISLLFSKYLKSGWPVDIEALRWMGVADPLTSKLCGGWE